MDIELILKVYPFFLEAAVVTIQLSVLTCILGLTCGALGAAVVTIQLSVLTCILGLTCGALGAAARLSRLAPLRWIAAIYVSLFRGTPALIQVFILYFGGPQIGIQLDAFTAGTIALGVNIGAYMTETIRGAIVSVDRGQSEAARTLGMSRWQTMRKVILPQAARMMIRPLGVNINALIKGTALLAPISVIELTYTAQRFIGSTYKPFEMFLLAGVLYMVIIYVVGQGINWLDRRARIS